MHKDVKHLTAKNNQLTEIRSLEPIYEKEFGP